MLGSDAPLETAGKRLRFFSLRNKGMVIAFFQSVSEVWKGESVHSCPAPPPAPSDPSWVRR